jgi:hypothetical protein
MTAGLIEPVFLSRRWCRLAQQWENSASFFEMAAALAARDVSIMDR